MKAAALLVRLSDVEPEEIRWLWPGRIPLGKLTILDGDPGTSKTTLALDLAARVSRGEAMPDGSKTDLDRPRGIVLLTAEDGLADTIRPRLDAAGADAEQVVALQAVTGPTGRERLPTIQDVGALREGIDAVDAALVILDPLVAYLGSGVDSHRDASVRAVLGGLAQLAEETGVAVLAIRHLNKSESSNALYRGGGSIAFTASARSVLLAGRDPGDPTRERKVLASSKCNVAEPQTSLAYRSIMASNGAVCIEWLGTSPHSADDLLRERPRNGLSKLEEAKQWLQDELGDGPAQTTELEERAELCELSWRTVRRASRELGVKPRKEGYGGPWVWELPDQEHEGREQEDDDHTAVGKNGADSNNLAIFENQEAENPYGKRTFTKAATSKDPGHLRGDEGQTKAATEPRPGHLRERPSGVRSFSDPRPEDGQDSGTGDVWQDGSEPEDQAVDGNATDRPGGRRVRIPVGLIDGNWS